MALRSKNQTEKLKRVIFFLVWVRTFKNCSQSYGYHGHITTDTIIKHSYALNKVEG